MEDSKKRFKLFKKSYFAVIGVLLLILLAVLLLCFNSSNSSQAEGATAAKIDFRGEYRIGDGEWQPIEKGKHISSSQGDVTLKGNFHLSSPDGEYV